MFRRALLRVVLGLRRLVVEFLGGGGGHEDSVDEVAALFGLAAVLDELLDLNG